MEADLKWHFKIMTFQTHTCWFSPDVVLIRVIEVDKVTELMVNIHALPCNIIFPEKQVSIVEISHIYVFCRGKLKALRLLYVETEPVFGTWPASPPPSSMSVSVISRILRRPVSSVLLLEYETNNYWRKSSQWGCINLTCCWLTPSLLSSAPRPHFTFSRRTPCHPGKLLFSVWWQSHIRLSFKPHFLFLSIHLLNIEHLETAVVRSIILDSDWRSVGFFL